MAWGLDILVLFDLGLCQLTLMVCWFGGQYSAMQLHEVLSKSLNIPELQLRNR